MIRDNLNGAKKGLHVDRVACGDFDHRRAYGNIDAVVTKRQKECKGDGLLIEFETMECRHSY